MTAPSRIRNVVEKVSWGLRATGPLAAVRGVGRLAVLRAVRPRRALVHSRSGFDLEFGARQVPTALVAFGDVIDPEYPFLRSVVRPGAVVVDVGAAIGQFTVYAGRVLGATVHAFEPVEANLVSLRANVRRNGLADRVRIHELALSDHAGEADFDTSGDTFRAGFARGSTPGQPVRVARLDEALERLGVGHVDVLKINVAGHEPGVIDGAEVLLERRAADVLVLLIGTGSFDRYRRISSLGYVFCFYDPATDTVHRIRHLDERMLAERPFPARHVLALAPAAVDRLLGGGRRVR
ncbi:hypothetical protein ASG49_08240 [Marmoricola sp. Leaf446]|uniref:FkbM family methyltransferase n=1 Tax=Marmoricola sp. Leaf446 TaxID=1736379 RepID=UPI0006F95B54|nr:FkbM family methyltransferase [Marmoricola sp. Leaf446]KQT91972.1 hypothetical protein ASG49_08240 [Marmoricola sp. Leaf446]